MRFFQTIRATTVLRVLCAAAALCATTTGCMKYGPHQEETFDFGPGSGYPQDGVFILHEGRFTYGEASLSYYIPSTGLLENEVFVRANGIKLGDVAQSVGIFDGKAYVAVNNSGAVFAIDPYTFRITGALFGVPSPRYIHFVSGEKAYITGYDDPRIAVFNPHTMQLTGHIDTGSHTSTEQMAAWGKWLFVTCWSYDNTVLVIDTETDRIVESLKTRLQPRWIAIDAYEKLWVLTDGGYAVSGQTREAPALYRIDAATRQIEKEFVFSIGDSPKGLALDGSRQTIYFLNGNLYRMQVNAEQLPSRPFFANNNKTIFYSLGVDPASGDVYLGDAIDYSQRAAIYRLNPDGRPVDTLRTGIIPTAFAFK